jgi:hypothetical protein
MEKVKKRYWHMPTESHIYTELNYSDNRDYLRNAYTGLVDIDLQPIYEDDIIYVVEEDREAYYAIERRDYKSYSIFDTYPVRQPYSSLGLAWITASIVKSVKIVGNIREEKYKKYRDLI